MRRLLRGIGKHGVDAATGEQFAEGLRVMTGPGVTKAQIDNRTGHPLQQCSDLLPDVPTIAEAAIPGFDFNVWWGMWALAGIPVKVKDTLVKDVARALASTDLREKLANKGFEPMSMSPAEFSQLVQREVDASVQTLKAAGIKPK